MDWIQNVVSLLVVPIMSFAGVLYVAVKHWQKTLQSNGEVVSVARRIVTEVGSLRETNFNPLVTGGLVELYQRGELTAKRQKFHELSRALREAASHAHEDFRSLALTIADRIDDGWSHFMGAEPRERDVDLPQFLFSGGLAHLDAALSDVSINAARLAAQPVLNSGRRHDRIMVQLSRWLG